MADFVERTFSSAHEFLNALRLSDPRWWTYHSVTKNPDQDWQRDWIFRGQSSSKWPLLPKAWRDWDKPETPLNCVKVHMLNSQSFQKALHDKIDSRQFLPPFRPLSDGEQKKKRQLMANAVIQAFAEISFINEFCDLADEVGFSVISFPKWKASQFVNKYVDLFFPTIQPVIVKDESETSDDLSRKEPFSVPNIEAQIAFWTAPAVALAQHHQIPTRLLDWTRNPLAAVFFAANGVVDSKVDDHLVVFALHKEMLKSHIRLVEVPSSSNDFLRAQAGLFTFDAKGEELLLLNGHYPSFEESIRVLPSALIKPQKLTLPVSQAPELVRLLWLERTTQAHLMPTLDNVAQAVVTKIRLAGRTTTIEQLDDV